MVSAPEIGLNEEEPKNQDSAWQAGGDRAGAGFPLPKVSQEECQHNHIFVYDNSTGNLPVQSIDGMTSVFVIHNWTTNAILLLYVTK